MRKKPKKSHGFLTCTSQPCIGADAFLARQYLVSRRQLKYSSTACPGFHFDYAYKQERSASFMYLPFSYPEKQNSLIVSRLYGT